MKHTKEAKLNNIQNNLSQGKLKLQSKQKPMIGVDIGTNSIEIVQMKNNGRIKSYGLEIVPEGMVNQGRVETIFPLADIIRRCINNNKIKGSTCSLCLSSNELIIRELTLPEMSEAQIYENIQIEITSILPLKHDEYCVDYKILEYISSHDNAPNKLRIMVATAPVSLIRSYMNVLKRAKLKVVHIDVAPNVVGKILKWMIQKVGHNFGNNNVCFIDFGGQSTQVIILKEGNYFIHKVIASGGAYLTSIIAEKGNMDFFRAEEHKYRTNFFDETSYNELNIHVKNYFEYLLTDIGRTMEFFDNRNNHIGIDHIFIMGGGSLLPGLRNFMKAHLTPEVNLISDVLGSTNTGNEFYKKTSLYTYAIGATMREEW